MMMRASVQVNEITLMTEAALDDEDEARPPIKFSTYQAIRYSLLNCLSLMGRTHEEQSHKACPSAFWWVGAKECASCTKRVDQIFENVVGYVADCVVGLGGW